MSPAAYDFEQPITQIEDEISSLERQLRDLDAAQAPAASSSESPAPEGAAPAPRTERERLVKDLDRLKRKLEKTRKDVYQGLTPWQRVQIARHLERPHTLDYIERIFTDWTEVHGDRFFADDKAMVTGYAFLNGQPVAIIGQQKGSNTRENVERNFGMAHPEGYRKALRVMKTASKFGRPIIVLVDTPGAYPGIGAEERSVAEAIAKNMKEMFALEVPIIVVIIGEGASGGAIGIGVGDAVLMFENAWYTVISPEGCASILWRDAAFAPQAAEALKLTAPDLLRLGVIDAIIPEPLGGAHQDRQQAAENLKLALTQHLERLQKLPADALRRARFEKYRKLGEFVEG